MEKLLNYVLISEKVNQLETENKNIEEQINDVEKLIKLEKSDIICEVYLISIRALNIKLYKNKIDICDLNKQLLEIELERYLED